MKKRESMTGRKGKQADIDDPVLEDALSKHKQPLSKEIKQQVGCMQRLSRKEDEVICR